MSQVYQFPRVTREESFGKILNYAKKQAFHLSGYVSDDCRRKCAVGVLLPKKMMKEIKANNMNGYGVDMLTDHFGLGAIKRATGMSNDELIRLQDMNDDGRRKDLLEYCRNELAKIERRRAKKAVAA